MQSETGFPSSHQLKSYVAYKSRLKLAARAVLSADAGLLVQTLCQLHVCRLIALNQTYLVFPQSVCGSSQLFACNLTRLTWFFRTMPDVADSAIGVKKPGITYKV